MMRILHSADWHLGAPLRSLPQEQARRLRRELLQIPSRVAKLCVERGCDMILLSGDIFDGNWTRESVEAVRRALREAAVPVFIAPGNHDPYWERSPWQQEVWPENVHIFRNNAVESVAVEALSCRVYGGAFTGAESEGLLEGFRAQCHERYAVGILHADPLSVDSPYCPVTRGQVQESGLDYLALGHIHAFGSFTAGATLAAWPGCAMGRGFDETGIKGAVIVTLEDTARAEFCPLEGLRFYDLKVEDEAALQQLPAQGSEDFYRITFTGRMEPPDLEQIRFRLARFPNLILRDHSRPPVQLWAGAGEDNLEGVFFRILQEAMEGQDYETVRTLELAAKLSRQLLQGQEVQLP